MTNDASTGIILTHTLNILYTNSKCWLLAYHKYFMISDQIEADR